MRILLTNNSLAWRAGTELYVRDLAIALMRLGHYPVAYSSVLGEVAQELRRASVPVIDDLNALNEPPDLIHGQHHLEAMTAMLRFPQVPAIYVCHGWLPSEKLPPIFPSICRYVANDELCRERLLTTKGIDTSMIDVLFNSADLERFSTAICIAVKTQVRAHFQQLHSGRSGGLRDSLGLLPFRTRARGPDGG